MHTDMDSIVLPENGRAAQAKTYNFRTVITAVTCAGSIAVVAGIVGVIRHALGSSRAMM